MTPFWRRPIWVLGHVIALAAVVSFVRLGFWQLDRLEEKKDRNRIIAARSDGPPVDVLEVDLRQGEYQHVTATGRFDTDDEVLIRNRGFSGTIGQHVVTPFVLDDGRAVLVNRGWIGIEDDVPPPPDGELEIEGLLLATQTRGSVGPRDPADGELDVLNRIDVARIQQQTDLELLPLHLQLQAPVPPDGELPLALPPPARDEGPHLSYAAQWFLFSGVVLVGYPLLMRRRARDQRREQRSDADVA